jgi:serine protease inhibitor
MKKVSFKTHALILIAVLFMFSGCKKTSDQPLPKDPVQIPLTSNQISLISSENNFAFDIFREVLSKAAESDNLIISPFSISTALSMTLNGAAGATQDSMKYALRLDSQTPDNINLSYKDLQKALLNTDSRVIVTIANSVWTEKNFQVKEPFRNILTSYYYAEAKSFDGTDNAAYKIVNSWIEDKTNGLIKDMLSNLNEDARMLLINAIYFKAKWKYQFDAAKTADGTFHKADGSTEQVPMMKQEETFSIFTGDGYTLAEFPYGQGNFVMDVLIPGDQKNITDLVPLLTAGNFNNAISQMSKRKIDLWFPKFKYGFKQELHDILSDMGMGLAFSDLADFSNIADESLKISRVLHQAFIETKEDGTEAAAATVVEIINTSYPPVLSELKLDHPFIYLIRETSTNSILFIGKVADPLK